MNVKSGKWLFAALTMVMGSVAFADPVQDAELAELAEKAIYADDLPKAMELLNKAALQGYAPAQARLGDILDIAEDKERAVFWYNISVEAGSAAGEMGLGNMYLKGEGVKKDADKGVYWIRRAAEQNYLPAMELLVKTLRHQAQIWEDKAEAMKVNLAAEKEVAEKAAAEKAADKSTEKSGK